MLFKLTGYGTDVDEPPGELLDIIGVCLTLNGNKLGGKISGICKPSLAFVINCIDLN
jgi:hypothetical protein